MQTFRIVEIFPVLINLRRMCEGYGSRSVCLSVRLSVTALAATYLVYTLKAGYH